MKPRLPRKYKKQIKKVVAVASASRIVRAALISMSSAFQVAAISAQPWSFGERNEAAAAKAFSVADVVSNAAKSISEIISEKPQSWRDFIR